MKTDFNAYAEEFIRSPSIPDHEVSDLIHKVRTDLTIENKYSDSISNDFNKRIKSQKLNSKLGKPPNPISEKDFDKYKD